MKTISAPNGTKFIKPDFECVLYEETEHYIYGRAMERACKWNKTGYGINDTGVNLTPAPQPWYENLGKGKLCWVWSYSDEPKTIQIVKSIHKDITGSLQFQTPFNEYNNAEPLTPEEALEYLVKDQHVRISYKTVT